MIIDFGLTHTILGLLRNVEKKKAAVFCRIQTRRRLLCRQVQEKLFQDDNTNGEKNETKKKKEGDETIDTIRLSVSFSVRRLGFRIADFISFELLNVTSVGKNAYTKTLAEYEMLRALK